MSVKARAYLTTALIVMEKHALVGERVDWPKLRSDAFAQAEGARTPQQTYGAITVALHALGDGHSDFLRW